MISLIPALLLLSMIACSILEKRFQFYEITHGHLSCNLKLNSPHLFELCVTDNELQGGLLIGIVHGVFAALVTRFVSSRMSALQKHVYYLLLRFACSNSGYGAMQQRKAFVLNSYFVLENARVMEPFILLFIGYMSYIVAEIVHFSGIIRFFNFFLHHDFNISTYTCQ